MKPRNGQLELSKETRKRDENLLGRCRHSIGLPAFFLSIRAALTYAYYVITGQEIENS
jgi:hypothetical protein